MRPHPYSIKFHFIRISLFKISICVAVALLSATRLASQEYIYAHYDVKEGLASSVVYTAAQDKEGFMWFGTDAGLSRFDGSTFKNFTMDDGLPDNEILKLFVDSKNRIWITPFRNELCYYYKGKIHTAKNDSLLRSLKFNSTVNSIAENGNGEILILSNTLAYYLRSDSIIRKIDSIGGKVVEGTSAAGGPGSDFRILVGVRNSGVNLVKVFPDHDSVEKTMRLFKLIGANSAFLSDDLDILPTLDGAHIYQKYQKGQLSIMTLPENLVSISNLFNGFFAVNSAKGSLIYDAKTSKLFGRYLDGEIVNSVVTDDEQNWWFCTTKGAFRLLSKDASRYQIKVDGKPSTVYSIEKSDSTFYFGTDRYCIAKLNQGKITVEKLSTSLSPGRVTTFAKMSPNVLILGGDNSVILLKPTKKVLTLSMAVKSIQAYPKSLLVAFHQGVIRFEWPKFNGYDTIWQGRSTAAREINNEIYIGTLSGLYKVDSLKRSYAFGSKYPQLASRISALATGMDGTLWVATYGFGVFGIRNDTPYKIITTAQGLSSNSCRTLFVDSNAVWVASTKGLDKIELNTDSTKITRFTTADGLPESGINAIYVDGNYLYIGSSEGVARLDASKPMGESQCRLKITGIQFDQNKWYYDTSHFVLPHNYDQLRFDYSGIAYKSWGDIVYYYRLHGLDNNWQTTRNNFLSYPSLPSGYYTLEIYAVNKFGVKSNMLSIPFGVKKTFQETIWFQLLGLMLLIGIVWIVVSLRSRWLRRKQKAAIAITERITELEQMALKAQMNPHFIFNCLNSIQQYVMEKDFEGVNKFITDFAKLIRKTLDASSKREISLEDELDYISTYLRLERNRLEGKFSFQIHVDKDVIPSDYFLPPMILQPCLENSIRHGIRFRQDNLGMIKVFIRKDNDFLYCIIEDNGIGRKLAAEYKTAAHIEYQSRGMDLTKNRIELLSLTSKQKATAHWEDILNQDGEVNGTRVTIQFPLEEHSDA